jgi:peroxin-5
VWDQLQKSDLPPPEEDMAKWEAEFNQMMNNQRNMDFDYDHMGLGQWEDPSPPFQSVAFDSDGIPLLGDYEFGSFFSPIRQEPHEPEMREQ